MVEVQVARLGVDSTSQAYVVILQERDGDRLLPIWIGRPEAESIVMQMHDIKRPRPLTHDLCRSIVIGLQATVQRVQITRVENSTFFAELHLVRGDSVIHVDARPSDGIAMALRFNAPIFAAEELLTLADDEDENDGDDDGIDVADEPWQPGPPVAEPREGLSADELKAYLETLRPEDFGEFNL
jgi:uncharacterized protein